MRSLLDAALLLATTLSGLLHAQPDPAALLDQARKKIVENIEKLSNYTCVQTVRRSQYQPLSSDRSSACRDVQAPAEPLILAKTDQFKLDVTVSNGAEIFSWAGARTFQSSDAQEIVGGGLTGSGDFGRFLESIFGSGGTEHQFLAMERSQGQSLAVYLYHVPKSASHYQLKLGPKSSDLATLAYEGKFWIDPQNAELRKLTIVVPDPPLALLTCRIETSIEYQYARIGSSWLRLPQLTALTLWDSDGFRFENQTTYSACRAFQSESVLRAELTPSAGASDRGPQPSETPVEIPSGTSLQISVRLRLDEENAFAGDVIEGRVLQPVRVRNGSSLGPQNVIVHGRIVRCERHLVPSSYFVLGLKFDSLSVDGHDIPINLEFSSRSRADRTLNGPLEKRQGIGMFMFPGDRMLERDLISLWKVTPGIHSRR